MHTGWYVVVDTEIIRRIQGNKRSQIELDAFQRRLRSGGPASLDWDAQALTGSASWEDLLEPHTADSWLMFELQLVRVIVEVRPWVEHRPSRLTTRPKPGV